MLAKWTELLPVFIYKWLARKFCEQVTVQNDFWCIANRNILVRKHNLKLTGTFKKPKEGDTFRS